jgi:hypothetical protein
MRPSSSMTRSTSRRSTRPGPAGGIRASPTASGEVARRHRRRPAISVDTLLVRDGFRLPHAGVTTQHGGDGGRAFAPWRLPCFRSFRLSGCVSSELPQSEERAR